MLGGGASAQRAVAKPQARTAAPAIDKKAVEDYLRHLELWVPQVKVVIDDPKPSSVEGLLELPVHLSYGNVSQDQTYYISRDGRYILRASIYDLHGNPFASDLSALNYANQPSFGPANAPLTLALFSDFECPLCKEEAQVIRKNIPASFPNDVRVVFFDLPLDAIHPWARPAAIAGRCVYDQNPQAFWSYFDWMYGHQAEIKVENLKDKIMEWAKTNPGINIEKLTGCIASKATEPEVNRTVEEARKLGISGTPTSFLNGRRMVGSTPWQNLEQIIRIDLEYARSHSK
jgi:protein-disulfide isomerase